MSPIRVFVTLLFVVNGVLVAALAAETSAGTDVEHRLSELRAATDAINPIGEIQFSKDGSRVAALEIYSNSTWINAVHIWDTKTYEEVACIKETGNSILTFAIAPDSKSIVTGSKDGQLTLWEIPSGKKIWNFERQHNGKNGSGINSLNFSPDGAMFASSGSDNIIVVRDTATGAERLHLAAGTEHGIGQGVFSPDSHFLAGAGGFNKIVFVWELPSGTLIYKLKGHKLPVFQTMFTSDGKRLISGASKNMGIDDVEIFEWDMATGQQIRQFDYGKGAGIEMAVWPDDKHLATWQGEVRSTTFGFMNQTINLLNLDGGKGRKFKMPSSVPAYGLAFSSDGKFIATGTAKGAVTLWNLQGIDPGK